MTFAEITFTPSWSVVWRIIVGWMFQQEINWTGEIGELTIDGTLVKVK